MEKSVIDITPCLWLCRTIACLLAVTSFLRRTVDLKTSRILRMKRQTMERLKMERLRMKRQPATGS